MLTPQVVIPGAAQRRTRNPKVPTNRASGFRVRAFGAPRNDGERFSAAHYPATSLMRAISSSTALSTGTFSLTTRFIALAQTFSLLRIVNLQFLVKSNGAVPPVNWL